MKPSATLGSIGYNRGLRELRGVGVQRLKKV